MWQYFLNWMGPINPSFIAEHGDHWSAGRIDAWTNETRDPDYDPFNVELGIGPMHSADWAQLADWLADLETPRLLTKQELIAAFEAETGTAIRWLHRDDS